MISWAVLLTVIAFVSGLLMLDSVARCTKSCNSMLDEYERTLRNVRESKKCDTNDPQND